MVLAHNVHAENGRRMLGRAENAFGKSTKRLSTGYRINAAADDAAGLTISEKMRNQIRGLNRASLNAQDGISLIQTAEGSLGEVHSILKRVRELAVQAGNDTNTDIDRDAIQEEINELVKETDRIGSSTQYNTMNLLDGTWADPNGGNPAIRYVETRHGGSLDSREVSVTALSGDRSGEELSLEEVLNGKHEGLNIIYNESSNDFITQQTGIGGATPSGYGPLKTTLKTQIVPQAVKALLDTYSSTFGYLNNSSIGIGLNLVNAPSSNVLASVSIGWYTDAAGVAIRQDRIQYQLEVNMATLSFDPSGELTAASRRALETTIVHEMTHALMDEALTNGMIGASDGKKDASNKFPGWFAEGMAQASAGGCSNDNDWVNGSLGIHAGTTQAQISAIVKSNANALARNTGSSQYGTGYLACMYLGYLMGGSNIAVSAVAHGLDRMLSEIKNGKSLNDVIAANTPYAGLNDFQSKFGDAQSAAFIKQLVTEAGLVGNGSVVTGSYTSNDLLPDANHNTNLFQLDTNYKKVENKYPAGTDKFTDGGSRVTITGGGNGGGGGGNGGNPILPGGGLNLQVGPRQGQGIKIFIEEISSTKMGIDNLDVSTFDHAGDSITAVDHAIDFVSGQRSVLGALQNRLEHTISNLNNMSENTSSAESRIRDTDMALEMVEYTKYTILMQAGQSILAQANQTPNGILSLLQ